MAYTQKLMQIPVTIINCCIATTVPRTLASAISELYSGTAALSDPTAKPIKNRPTN